MLLVDWEVMARSTKSRGFFRRFCEEFMWSHVCALGRRIGGVPQRLHGRVHRYMGGAMSGI